MTTDDPPWDLEAATQEERGRLDLLIPVVYEELRGLAGLLLSDKAANLTLQPTSLVHEVYLMFPNCYQSHISLGQLAPGSGDAVLIDLGDTAAVTRLTSTGAEIAAFGGGTIHITWAPGEPLSTWENGFTVATSRSSVRISGSDDASYTVEDLGLLSTPGKK